MSDESQIQLLQGENDEILENPEEPFSNRVITKRALIILKLQTSKYSKINSSRIKVKVEYHLLPNEI